jgi:hypothetical protein
LDALFRGGDLRASLDHQRQRIFERIDKLSDDEVVDGEIRSIASDLADEFAVHAIELDREDVSYDQRPTKVRPGRDRDPFFGPVDGVEVRFFVPFAGDATLLKLRPSTFTTLLPRAERITDGTIEFRYSVDQNQMDAAADRLEKDLDLIEQYAGWQQDWLDEFNDALLDLITERLEDRHAKIEEARDRLEDKGFRRRVRSVDTGGQSGRPRSGKPARSARRSSRDPTTQKLDVFISHASEDKAAVARPIFEALSGMGVSVWFDEAELTLGDSLRRKIDEGLTRCRFGVVILSRPFFLKEWPQRELDGLVARETASGEKAILPVWHEIDHDTVVEFSPTLADRFAANTEKGLDFVVAEILKVLA